MEYRNLGRSGLQVSVVGLGCNNFGMRADYAATEAVVRACLDSGINFFDTADIYGGAKSEEFLGKALGADRQDVIVASKCGVPMGEGPLMRGASRRYIMQAVEASLRRLGTDYLDLYQIHFPDPDTPHDETLRALDDLVRSGKVRYIGNSNFAGWAIADCHWIARHHHLTPFVSAQNEYSLLKRGIEAEVLPACEQFGLGMLPYFPLASGLLTGKYRRGEDAPEGARLSDARFSGRVLSDRNWEIVERLEAWCEDNGRSLLEVAFGWLLANPAVSSVIAGATKPEQVASNAAAGEVQLSAEEVAEISELAPA